MHIKKILKSNYFNFFSDIFKYNNLMNNFQEFITNIFLPLFEVTNNPKSHPNLHQFLQYVSIILNINIYFLQINIKLILNSVSNVYI